LPRIKRAVDCINALCSSESEAKSMLGNALKQRYERWLETLNLQDFLRFIETIKENKDQIGVPQFFGKFRACTFEECVYRLIVTKVDIPEHFNCFGARNALFGGKVETICHVVRRFHRQKGKELR